MVIFDGDLMVFNGDLMMINGDLMVFNEDLIMIDPLVNSQFATLKMTIEVVDLPINNGGLP